MQFILPFLRRPLLTAILCLLIAAGAASSGAQTTAIGVVERYMQGLFAGDVATIQDCLDDLFQARRENTLKDPAYPAFLIERYSGATYHIQNSATQANGKTIVDVEIIYRSAETVVIRLMLNRRNQIVDEMLL
jgi:hypothetical protein